MKWFSGWAFPDSALDDLRSKCDAGILAREEAMTGMDARLTFPILGSWSLGSFQSLEMAVENPRSVAALIVISSTPKFCAAEDFACGQAEGHLRAMQRSFMRDARMTLGGFHKLCAEPAVLPASEIVRRIEQSLAIGTDRLASGLRNLREKDVRAGIAKVTCPVLLLHGEDDRVIPCDASRWMKDRLSNATLLTLPGAGHDLPIRNADWVAEEIRKFAESLA